jgi:subtilase family serine protease
MEISFEDSDLEPWLTFTLGKWWTNEQILDLIAPSKEDIRPVIEWLKENGVDRIDLSGRDFIKVSASIGTIEKLFRTRMHNYKNEDTGKPLTKTGG